MRGRSENGRTMGIHFDNAILIQLAKRRVVAMTYVSAQNIFCDTQSLWHRKDAVRKSLSNRLQTLASWQLSLITRLPTTPELSAPLIFLVTL